MSTGAEDSTSTAGQNDHWCDEREFRNREMILKEREQATRDAEVDLKRKELEKSEWRNPLVVAILAAAVAV
jgi:hypothetical protein